LTEASVGLQLSMQRLRVKAPMHMRFRRLMELPIMAGCNSGDGDIEPMVVCFKKYAKRKYISK
jgi:hypothetical protein